jgi:predicted dehydrogenase/NADPH:quinone reductase-like Zn-dependent oxidoreductase
MGRLKDFLNDQATVRLRQLGHSEPMISDAKREAWWWLQARGRALARRTGLLSGSAIVWTATGRAELVRMEVPRARTGEVTVGVVASVVNTGTERAQYLRSPNAAVAYPHRPGYSAAGVVLGPTPAASRLRPGDLVAVRNVAHASVVTVPERRAHPVPHGVSAEAAAMVQLGVICGQGVRRAGLRAGDPVCVVGAGLIGVLAARLAVAAGAGPVSVIALSRAKEGIARGDGVERFLVTSEDANEIATLASPVVIEATGDPNALPTAVAAAGDDARVVLLGSPRGITVDVPFDGIRAKRLRVVGAHVDTLGREPELAGVDPFAAEAERFLDQLASGRVHVADLLHTVVDPREAAAFYRRLATARDIVGARFDWTLLGLDERSARARFLRVPDLRARGADFRRKPLSPRSSHKRRASTPRHDAFHDADGRLRVALLGCGDVAVLNAAGIHSAPNVRLVACYDPIRALADDIARVHGVDVAPTSDALLERPDIDAVVLSVPHHLHAPLGAQAAAAGKHVIVEKPLANDLAAAVKLVKAAERGGVVLSVCFPHRYHPSVVEARRLIGAGALGAFTGALLTFFMDKPPSYWVGGFTGRAHSSWRSSRQQAGGGVLIMNLCHYVDLLRHLSGVEAELVSARADAWDADAEVEDAVSVTVEYAGGALGSLVACAALPGSNSESELRLWGPGGQIAVEPDARVYTLRAVEGLRTNRWQTFGRQPEVDVRAVYFSRLGTALDRGEPPDVTARDGLAVQAFIEAAYRSCESGRAVSPGVLLEDALV